MGASIEEKKNLDFWIKIEYHGKSINAVKETLVREHDRNTAPPTESAVYGNDTGNTPEQIVRTGRMGAGLLPLGESVPRVKWKRWMNKGVRQCGWYRGY